MKPVLQLSSLELARKRIVCVHIVFLCGNGCSFFLLLIASSRWCFIIFSRNSLPDHLILPWVLPQAAGCMAGWMVVGWPFSRSGFIHAVALRSFAREGSGYCSCGSRKGVKIMLVQNFGIHFRWNTYRDKDTLHHQTIFFWKLPLQRWIDLLFHLYTSPKLYSSFQVREDASRVETVQRRLSKYLESGRATWTDLTLHTDCVTWLTETDSCGHCRPRGKIHVCAVFFLVSSFAKQQGTRKND